MPVRAQRALVPALLPPGVFSTAGLPAARRVELWESHNAAALIGLDVRAPGPLDATELNVQLPRARLARVTGTSSASNSATEPATSALPNYPASGLTRASHFRHSRAWLLAWACDGGDNRAQRC